MALSYDLTETDFQKIAGIVYNSCRLNLKEGKKELVQARLQKRLRKLNLSNYKDYLKLVESDPREFTNMIDSLSTNLTMFFREMPHFDFLRREFLPRFDSARMPPLRIWSAGCSSGEEPYSLAIMLREYFRHIDLMDCLVLATDISTRVLDMAKKGIYSERRITSISAELRRKYFFKLEGPDTDLYSVSAALKRMIRFRYLNLMEPWPMNLSFDVIFCRNVMIYFDKQTQQELVTRFHNMLRPGGIFIVGHSESLVGITHNFDYMMPSVYGKKMK